MDEQQGQPGENDGRGSQNPVVSGPIASRGDKKHQTEFRNTSANEPRYVQDGLIKRHWNRFTNGGGDRVVELILAAAITFFAAGQWFTGCENNAATTAQTNQLISAAQINASASRQNALAAGSFANSAQSINHGISDAVDKLNLQASSLGDSAQQANVLAREIADSNITALKQLELAKTATEAQTRPWIGTEIQLTPTQQDISIDQHPPAFTVKLTNFGHSPAITQYSQPIWLIDAGKAQPTLFERYPICEYAHDELTRSLKYGLTNVVFPGDNAGAKPFSDVRTKPDETGVTPRRSLTNYHYLLSCTIYQSQSGELHYTRSIYEVSFIQFGIEHGSATAIPHVWTEFRIKVALGERRIYDFR
jgi:hypothetical protein